MFKFLKKLRLSEILCIIFLAVMIIIYSWLGKIPSNFVGVQLILVGTFLIIYLALTIGIITRKKISQLFNFKKILGFARDWIPLGVALFVYDNLHDITHLINSCQQDELLIKIDKFLFLGHHPTLIFERTITPYLTAWMSFAYSNYALLLPITFGLFYLFKKERFEFLVSAFLFASYLGFIGFIIVPCVGPILAQNHLYHIDIMGGSTFPLYNWLVNVFIEHREAFHCFPSLHVALSAIFLYFIFKYLKPALVFYAPFVLSLWFSTLYLRWHYVIDVIAGFALAVFSIWFVSKLIKKWKKFKPKHYVSGN